MSVDNENETVIDTTQEPKTEEQLEEKETIIPIIPEPETPKPRRRFPVPTDLEITTKPIRSIFGIHHQPNVPESNRVEKSPPKEPAELRKLKISRPCFNPLDGMNPEEFASKTEAYLVGYLNCLYHRLDGAKRIK